MQCRDLLWRISGQRKIYTQIVCEGSQSNCFSGLIHFPLGHFRWSAFYCILTVMVVCIICACKGNQVEELWTTVAFMKPFALLYCSALLCKQRHTQSTHHPTHTWTCTYAAVQTLLPLLPNWYNGLYFHSSLDKRVVPLERWIVANWMRIYHEARAMCEKWGMSLFWSACFHSFNDSLVFAYAFSSWAWPLQLSHACTLSPSSSWWTRSSIITEPHHMSETHHPHIFCLMWALCGAPILKMQTIRQ